MAVVDEGWKLGGRLGGEVKEVAEEVVEEVGRETTQIVEVIGREGKQVVESLQRGVEDLQREGKQVLDYGRDETGGRHGLTREFGGEDGLASGRSYVGGSQGEVEAKREVERTVEGRLV